MQRLTVEHLQKGLDEDGKRIKIFTSSLTGEHAVKANVGAFTYTGATQKAEAGSGKSISNLRTRVHKNNLPDDAMRHGYGECVYASGNMYKGEWKDDKRDGKGTFVYSSGDAYEGEWKDGKYHGVGRYTSTGGGDCYDGEWSTDKPEGAGTYFYIAEGEKYCGNFLSGLREGAGMYFYNNGNVYSGQYHHGEKHGGGMFYYASTGDVEQGRYDVGKDSGVGVLWDATRMRPRKVTDGVVGVEISQAEAAHIASSLGMAMPPVGMGPPAAPLPNVGATPSTAMAAASATGAA